MRLVYRIIESPAGRLKLVASDSALQAVSWDCQPLQDASKQEGPHPVLDLVERQLGEYFQGRLTRFEVDLEFGGSEFQRKVWEALSQIPYGQTYSYGQMAQKVGSPKACRAVGAAAGKNPIAIIVPCHRLVGSTGKLTGFAGGLKIKDLLLGLERFRDEPRLI